MTIYCYTISLQGPAEDVWYFRDLLDEALDVFSFSTERAMDEDDLIDMTITYETQQHFTRDQLDNLLNECYNIFHDIEIDGVISGTWVMRKAKINI